MRGVLKAFLSACERGKMARAARLGEKLFGAPRAWPADRSPADKTHAIRGLQRACLQGRVELADWLVDKYALTRQDVRAGDDHILRWAYFRQDRHVAHWAQLMCTGEIVQPQTLQTYEDACAWIERVCIDKCRRGVWVFASGLRDGCGACGHDWWCRCGCGSELGLD